MRVSKRSSVSNRRGDAEGATAGRIGTCPGASGTFFITAALAGSASLVGNSAVDPRVVRAAKPGDVEACAYALQQGDQTLTRLQHRINSTRRATHTALKETRTPRSPRPGRRCRQPRPRFARNPNAQNPVANPWESPQK